MKTIEQIAQRIGDLPNNGAVYIDAGGRETGTRRENRGDILRNIIDAWEVWKEKNND